jgi:DNA-binding transcriptional LysR family regulator
LVITGLLISEVLFNLEWKQLCYFITVADSGSFSTAAEKLFITQPAISKAVRKLEEEFSCRLLQRSPTGVTLTEQGQFLYDQFVPVLKDYENMSERLREYYKVCRGALTLYMGQGVFRSLDPNLLLDFSKDYSEIKMYRYETIDDECYRAVLENKCDLGIAVKPNELSEFDYIPVKKEPLYLFVNDSNPLSKRKSIRIEELKNERFVAFDSRFSFRDALVKECRRCGFEPDIILSSGEVEMLVKLVAENHGIFICVEHVAKSVNFENVKVIPITETGLEWEIGFISRKNETISYESRLFIDFLLNSVRKQL